MARVKVMRRDELGPGEIRRVEVAGTPVAVVALDGQIFAFGDTCSHEEASLAEGYLEGELIECPRHGAQFEVRSGRNVTLPATRPVPSFAVEVDGADVYVEVPEA